MKPGFSSLILICLACSVFGQKKMLTSDILYLKNGNRLTGQIIQYEQDQKVTLKLKDNSKVTILASEIDRIVQETVEEEKVNENYISTQKINTKPRTQGTYNITQLSFAIGGGDGDGLALGAGISTILGFQIKPSFGIGLGVGLDNYARRGETIYPVFIDLRSYLPTKKNLNAYYIALNSGYGFAFPRENIGIIEAEGGFLIHGAFGYRTTTREGVDVNIDAGLRVQKANFSRTSSNGDIEERDLVFQRFTIRVGIGLWGKK